MAQLGDGLNGYLDVQDATLRAPRLEAVSNIGIANTAPQHAFSVGSNLYIDTESSNVLTVDGNVVCEGVKVGLIEITPSYDFAAVSNVGNVTQSTIQFSNATTGFVTTANIEVGTANLFVDTTTSRVGVNTATPDASLHVTGNAYVSSNLEVGTANLFVDTVSGRVGIGTNSPVSGLTVSKDIESSNSFITERVLFRETWPNGLNSLVGDLGTWVVTNLNQQTSLSSATTPDGYGIVAFKGVPADNGEFVSPAFDLSDYALSDGVLPATNKRKTTTRVFLKCYFGTRNLSASGEVAHVQFSPDNGSTWYTVATSQDEKNTDRFTMVSADLSPYILETSTNAKIRFYMPWSVAGGDYMRIGRIWIHESDVPTNLGGMWLGAGGNIGIGTVTPVDKFHLYGSPIIQHSFTNYTNTNASWYIVGTWDATGPEVTQKGGTLHLTFLGGQLFGSNPAGKSEILAKVGNSAAYRSILWKVEGEKIFTDVRMRRVSTDDYKYDICVKMIYYTNHTMRTECSRTTSFERKFTSTTEPSSTDTTNVELGIALPSTDAYGKLGIGMTSPSSYLSIRGNYTNSQAPTTYNSAPPLCVVNPTSADGQPICQFRTNQGVTNVRNDGIYHKRGNGDVLKLYTSSSNPIFGNGTTGAILQMHNNGTAYFNCALRADSYNNNSDDRVKHNESSIKNAIQTLFKLKPQKYDKVSMDIDVLEHSQYLNATDKEGYEWNDIEDGWIKRKPIASSACITETGLIAQDIWYDAPELRHIVSLPDDAIPDDTKPSEPDPGNIRSDPDYDSAGWGKMGTATVNYINLIPYMIKSIKELYNEVTRHKTRVPTELYSNVQNYRHMIVSKHGDNIQLANTENDKAVHGVISDIKTDTDNYEILIEHTGMGNVWVLNTGSNIESGDYITTSNVTGYGMLQDSTFFMNHTIGKSTIDCDFTVQTTPIKQKIRRLQDKTHWIKTARLVQCSLMAYSNLADDVRTTKTETYYNTYENSLDLSNVEQDAMQYIIDNEHPIEITESEMNFEKYSNTYAVNTPFHTGPQTRTNYYRKRISKLENELEGYEPIVEQEMMDVLDDNGQVQWEDTGDTRPLYDLRYLTIDGSITDQSNAVYTASLVPVSLHL